MQPRFKVGDKVRYSNRRSQHIRKLTVGSTRLIEPDLSNPESPRAPYYRVLATRDDGRGSIEAAERFFELE